MEDTGLRLSADTIAGPAENTAVVHFCPWYVVQNALRPIYSGKCKYNIRKENVKQSGAKTKTTRVLRFTQIWGTTKQVQSHWSKLHVKQIVVSISILLLPLPNKSPVCLKSFELSSQNIFRHPRWPRVIVTRNPTDLTLASPVACRGCHSHLICDCCMSSFSSPLLKTHSNSRPLSPGLASTPQVTLTLSPLAAPNTSLAWAAHTGASADTEMREIGVLMEHKFYSGRAAGPLQALGVHQTDCF